MYSIPLTNDAGYSQFEAGLDQTYSAEFSSRSDLSEKSSVDLPDGRVSSATVNRRDLKSSTTYTQGMSDVCRVYAQKDVFMSLSLSDCLSSFSLSVFWHRSYAACPKFVRHLLKYTANLYLSMCSADMR